MPPTRQWVQPLTRKAKRLSDSVPGVADYGMIILLATIFGASFMLTKIIIADVPPVTLVTGRLLVAFFILLCAMLLVGQRFPTFGTIWLWIAASAVFGNALPFVLISWGQEVVDAGLAAILMAIMPLSTIVLAHFYTRDEKLNLYKTVGFVLGIFGVVVLIGYDKLATLGDDTIRQIAILCAAFCYAINAIITKKLVGLPQRSMATALIGVSFVIIVPFAFLVENPMSISLSADAWVAWILLAVFPTAVGTLLIFAIVKRQGAGFLSQINFMVPVAGVFWGIVILSEQLPLRAWLALAIILAGVAISRIKPNSRDQSLANEKV